MRHRDLLQVVLELLSVTATVWIMLPAHERQAAMMSAIISAQRFSQRIARVSARWAIRRELRGEGETVGYQVAYDLMTGPFERAGRLYNKIRGAI